MEKQCYCYEVILCSGIGSAGNRLYYEQDIAVKCSKSKDPLPLSNFKIPLALYM